MDDTFREKINLDELFTQDKEDNGNKTKIYQTILQRVHTKIKITSRQRDNMKCCWFVIPEFILGLPKYNIELCTQYIMSKLDENGFIIKYTYPNLLFISWNHYIPDYERMTIKKEQGITIDGFGNVINKKNKKDDSNPNSLMLKNGAEMDTAKTSSKKSDNDKYKSINTYKPGGLIYSNELINSINNATHKG
jgi:hypothetical protein